MEEGKIIYKDLSYKIVGLCFKAHDKLGRFCKEKQYCDLLEILFRQAGIKFEREKDLSVLLGENKIGGNRVDFMIDGKILLDAKAKNYITREDYRQMKRYLSATGLKLCLSSTFQNTLRSWRRDKWQINYSRRVQYPAVKVLDLLVNFRDISLRPKRILNSMGKEI